MASVGVTGAKVRHKKPVTTLSQPARFYIMLSNHAANVVVFLNNTKQNWNNLIDLMKQIHQMNQINVIHLMNQINLFHLIHLIKQMDLIKQTHLIKQMNLMK